MTATAPTEDLATIEAAVWQQLEQAVHDKGHPWRFAVLASSADEQADARLVVLREFDPGQRELVIFTDARSPKVRQLQARPAAVLVLWSAPLAWQLRLNVRVEIETSGLAVSSRWARMKMSPAALDYLSPLPPGSPLGAHERPLPQRGEREHFALMRAHIERCDWLALGPQGQRRAEFAPGVRRWLTP